MGQIADESEYIQQPIVAKPHRPVYRMHRYFARRPYSVFAELVKQYSSPSSVILDPFCGGGVTLVEGILQGRRVIGFDINPLATFVTRMELSYVDVAGLAKAQARVMDDFRELNNRLFETRCRACSAKAVAYWYEYSAQVKCPNCSTVYSLAISRKIGVGKWKCPNCGAVKRFSQTSQTDFKLVDLFYHCPKCGQEEIAAADTDDSNKVKQIEEELQKAESSGLWIPNERIPDCNMQRESALFKKGIIQFRQLFTSRHLLSLGLLKAIILKQESKFREWLLFAFSSTLRYTNRMVTRNPSWRGNRPLEWAKPGFWLPPVHLEANVLNEFSRRCEVILRGKNDYLRGLQGRKPIQYESSNEVLFRNALSYNVDTLSSTSLPLPNESVDVIITDPPYGSYVHYIDLSNFWSVWLPEIDGMGRTIDSSEEAVIARKAFPGAKSAIEYQRLLERCFAESARVLKPNSRLILTFNNREPRAWAALLVATTKSGFELLPNGLVYQDGIPSYRHTAQSRRHGSIIGDFILSFKKLPAIRFGHALEYSHPDLEKQIVEIVHQILRREGPQPPDELVAKLYKEIYPLLINRIRAALAAGGDAVERLFDEMDRIRLFNSERRQLLEQYFNYDQGKWSLKESA
jgi:predicted RNA-binding Zn-ribbon protein involved in translation (DUF1610 family)